MSVGRDDISQVIGSIRIVREADHWDYHGITHRKLEGFVANHAVIGWLRERVTAGRVDETFAARKAEFDTVWLARFNPPGEESARHVANQVRTGEVGFYEAAERRLRFYTMMAATRASMAVLFVSLGL